MIKLSRMADYAVVIMCEIAARPGELMSARALSEKTGISETAAMKILKMLAKAQLVESVRGPKGGYTLVDAPKDINVLDVVSAIDGPVAFSQCSHESHDECDFASACSAKQGLNRINRALKNTLEEFTLADVIDPFPPLKGGDASQVRAL